MATRNFVQGIDYYLAGSGVTLSATTISLSSMEYPNGDLVEMADFGDLGYATMEPETDQEENISFTGITQNADGSATLTGVTRGLMFKTPYTADNSLRNGHAGDTKLRITNSAPFYNQLAVKKNDETIEGEWTFPSTEGERPKASSDTDTAVLEAYTTFGQLSRTAFAGVNNASTTVKGIVEEATQAENDTRTTTGGTGARLFINPGTLRATKYHDFASSVVGTDSYAITPTPAVTALADGDIYVFEVDVANTGAATLNVAALGAKAIKKNGSAALETNDLAAGSIITVAYDLDSDTFMLQTPVAKQQVSQSGTEIFALDVGATDTYAITLSPAPAAYTTGMVVYFGANTANTGAATLNVNGLGAKTIKKNFNSDLVTGDILAGQYVQVEYDGTNFQLMSPTSPITPFKVGLTGTRAQDAASGTQTIAHGLGRVPKFVTIFGAVKPNSNNLVATSQGFYDGTTQKSVYIEASGGGGTNALTPSVDSVAAVHLGIEGSGTQQVGTMSFDATNISIAWVKTGSPGTSSNMDLVLTVE